MPSPIAFVSSLSPSTAPKRDCLLWGGSWALPLPLRRNSSRGCYDGLLIPYNLSCERKENNSRFVHASLLRLNRCFCSCCAGCRVMHECRCCLALHGRKCLWFVLGHGSKQRLARVALMFSMAAGIWISSWSAARRGTHNKANDAVRSVLVAIVSYRSPYMRFFRRRFWYKCFLPYQLFVLGVGLPALLGKA